MTVEEFKARVIELGIQSVETHEKGNRRRGALLGFEICRSLMTPEDFEDVLRERQNLEIQQRSARMNVAEFWEFRAATAQIEHVWERMKIAWKLSGPYSARAMMQYASIVGVNTGNPN